MSDTSISDEKAGGPRAARRLGVVVVDPFPVVRAGLASTIGSSPGLEVLAEASSADEAVAVVGGIRRTRVVVLVAMGLAGDRDSYWLIRALREHYPRHAILGLGSNADPHVVSRALFVGADGFVDKNVELDEFLAAIRSAGADEMVIAGPAAASVGKIAEGIERRRSVGLRLTKREREVLAVAAEGLTAQGDRGAARRPGADGHDPPRADLRQAGRREPRRGPPPGRSLGSGLDRAVRVVQDHRGCAGTDTNVL